MDPLGPWAPSVPSATTIGRSVESELRGYVFAQSITLAGVALASAILPLALLRPDVLGVWLAIPFVATILAVYLVATFINRRFARIVRALKPDGSLSGESFRGRDFWR